MDKPNASPLCLGIYDSGLGGLSIVLSLEKVFPKLSLLYLADKKNNPYGSKTKEEILSFSEKNGKFLLNKKIDGLLIACHTSSVYAAEGMRKNLNVPLFDMTSSTLRSLKRVQEKRLVLLGTSATIQSGVYQKLIAKSYPRLKLYVCSCPSFVYLVEQGLFDKDEAWDIMEKDLEAVKGLSFDGFILGCTHFPFLRSLLEKHFPGKIFVDPAFEIAKEVKEYYEERGFTSSKRENHFFVTKGEEEFRRFGKTLLGYSLGSVEEVDLETFKYDSL